MHKLLSRRGGIQVINDWSSWKNILILSEPESQAIRNFVKRNTLSAFLTVHTYGQMILYPYADGRTAATVNKLVTSKSIKTNWLIDMKLEICGTSHEYGYDRCRQ